MRLYLQLQAKTMAIEAATAQMRAANASLKAVEDGIQLHASNRDYGKLKETAEASGLAAKARTSSEHRLDETLAKSCELSHTFLRWSETNTQRALSVGAAGCSCLPELQNSAALSTLRLHAICHHEEPKGERPRAKS